jgi:hypothetical protein
MIVALAQGGGGSATNAVTQLVPTNAPLPSVSGSTIGGIPTNYATPAVVSSIIGGSNYLAAIPAASTNQFAVTNDSRSLSLSSSANIFNAASYRIANGSFFETNIAPFYVMGDAADVANGEVIAIDVANGRILTGTESAGNVFTTNTILDDGAGNARFKSVAGNGNALTNLNAANVFGYLTNVQYFAGSTTNYTDANGNLVLSNTTTHAYSIKNPSSMDATNSGNLTVGGTLNAGTVIGGNLGNIVGLSSNTIIGEAGAAIAGSNYLVGVTAGGGSTNFTGVNSAGVQVTVPWSALPSGGGGGGGGGSATNAVVSVTTNGVMAASGITNLDIDATGNATVTVTNLGGTAHITIGATGGGGSAILQAPLFQLTFLNLTFNNASSSSELLPLNGYGLSSEAGNSCLGPATIIPPCTIRAVSTWVHQGTSAFGVGTNLVWNLVTNIQGTANGVYSGVSFTNFGGLSANGLNIFPTNYTVGPLIIPTNTWGMWQATNNQIVNLIAVYGQTILLGTPQ